MKARWASCSAWTLCRRSCWGLNSGRSASSHSTELSRKMSFERWKERRRITKGVGWLQNKCEEGRKEQEYFVYTVFSYFPWHFHVFDNIWSYIQMTLNVSQLSYRRNSPLRRNTDICIDIYLEIIRVHMKRNFSQNKIQNMRNRTMKYKVLHRTMWDGIP